VRVWFFSRGFCRWVSFFTLHLFLYSTPCPGASASFFRFLFCRDNRTAVRQVKLCVYDQNGFLPNFPPLPSCRRSRAHPVPPQVSPPLPCHSPPRVFRFLIPLKFRESGRIGLIVLFAFQPTGREIALLAFCVVLSSAFGSFVTEPMTFWSGKYDSTNPPTPTLSTVGPVLTCCLLMLFMIMGIFLHPPRPPPCVTLRIVYILKFPKLSGLLIFRPSFLPGKFPLFSLASSINALGFPYFPVTFLPFFVLVSGFFFSPVSRARFPILSRRTNGRFRVAGSCLLLSEYPAGFGPPLSIPPSSVLISPPESYDAGPLSMAFFRSCVMPSLRVYEHSSGDLSLVPHSHDPHPNL